MSFWVWGVSAAGLLAVGGIALNMLGRYSGLTVPREDPATVAALLEPFLVETRPAGAGPFPTALLFSGCDGVRDNLATWAEALVAQGWATIVVDSHTPRGFTSLQIWRLICAGQLFQGAERAGDVAVAIALARERAYVDGDRLALIGASHGGWAILEFLSVADHGQRPMTLTRWPEAPAGRPQAGLGATVLFYPYCGQLSRAARRGWTSAIPTLFLLVQDDAIADEEDCLALAAREAARGLPIETKVYPRVTHGFDQRAKAPLSTLGYDGATTATAVSDAVTFLLREVTKAGPAGE
ncbi:MAG: dienelactone hydrolase family protein [Pseudomonadota bacterium]